MTDPSVGDLLRKEGRFLRQVIRRNLVTTGILSAVVAVAMVLVPVIAAIGDLIG